MKVYFECCFQKTLLIGVLDTVNTLLLDRALLMYFKVGHNGGT